jgi:hypothetical protein
VKSYCPEVVSSRHVEFRSPLRSVSKSQIVFGPPGTFGWLRCAHLDADGMDAAGRKTGPT